MTIPAHFDGKAFVPDAPVDLPVGTTASISVEAQKPTHQGGREDRAENAESRFASLLQFSVDDPDAPTDLAHQHDHFLYGTPKR
jgi:hypothetical protein